jgi:hypothetical protein
MSNVFDLPVRRKKNSVAGHDNASADSNEVRSAVEGYISSGFAVVPVPPRSKAPKIKGWKERTFTAAHFRPNFNVALRHDNGLTDVDLDWREARDLAGDLLPTTARYGRDSARDGH